MSEQFQDVDKSWKYVWSTGNSNWNYNLHAKKEFSIGLLLTWLRHSDGLKILMHHFLMHIKWIDLKDIKIHIRGQ